MKQISAFIACFFVLMLLSNSINAQRVALVLGGGGAKGLSHIGVIKALEENQIPIDYIVGNSMGAFVGALYSSGYSIDEIESLVKSRRFSTWVKGGVEEQFNQSNSFDPDAGWISFPLIANRNGYQNLLPANIVSPVSMDYTLVELFSASSRMSQNNFDNLMIPFRCIASDIDSSSLVVLKDGQLSTSVRASITFPFYFRPVRIKGKLLFDGGMIDNFPIETAIQEFDPDFVIGSKAASNYPPANESDIISQLQSMLVRPADYSVPAESGILIESRMGNAGLLDFDQAERYIDSGYQATIRHLPVIKQKIGRRLSPDSLNVKRLKFRNKDQALMIDTLIIKGVNAKQSDYIRNKLNPAGKDLELREFRSRYFILMADDKIKFIFPELIYNPARQGYEMYLDVLLAEKFTGDFGGNISSTAVNQAFVGINYKYLGQIASTSRFKGYYGRFYSSILLNGRLDYPGKFSFFLDLTGAVARKDFFKNANYFYEDPSPSFLISDEKYIDLSMGHLIGKDGKLSVGLSTVNRDFNYYQTNTFSRNDTADQTSFEFINTHISFEINTLNKKQYSNAGLKLGLEMKYFNGAEKNLAGSSNPKSEEFIRYIDYYLLRLVYDNYFARTGKTTFGFYAEVSYSDQPLSGNYTASSLSVPSFEPVPEMSTLYLDRYKSYAYLAGGLKLIYSISKPVDFRFESYIFQPYKRLLNHGPDLQPTLGKSFSDPSFISSASVVYHSPLGPVSLSANYYERDGSKLRVMLNIGYLIFNRSMFD
jgi:NTE family protein